jgi:ankyrin repeat protein
VTTPDLRTQFLEEALWHGPLDKANHLLSAHPELSGSDIHVAAVLGDEVAVRGFLASDPSVVRHTSPPFEGDPLTYLGLSRYLRLDKTRSDAFVRTATALLDAGADPNAGFWSNGERETVLYGAAGVAHHGALTRVLIERGADPNDPEVVYHTPEDWDMDALRAVVETGRLTRESLSLMLLRKHDWHHTEGIQYLLEHGADPNFVGRRWLTPLQHAIQRDNDLPIIELLIDHGADFSVKDPELPTSALGLAARRGRGDILKLADRRGRSFDLDGIEAVLAECALGDEAGMKELVASDRNAVRELVGDGGQVLAEFAGNDNTRGVALLLDLGIPVDARFAAGDGYWGVAKESTALHVAAWRASRDTAKLLIERGADVNARDAKGNTPLVMAVKACVDSYWTEWRSPDTVAALLAAGASTEGVPEKSGYDEVDTLIAKQRGSR